MAITIPFDLSVNDLIKLAVKARQDGDYEKTAAYLNDALKLDSNCFEAHFMFAELYSSLDELTLSNDVCFKILNNGVTDDVQMHIFTKIAANFAGMGERDIAEYYLKDREEFFSFLSEEETDDDEDDYKVVYPRGEDYYSSLLEKAQLTIGSGDIPEAVKILKEIPEESKYYESATHTRLVCLIIENKFDEVIDIAKEYLLKSDSLPVHCTLAEALLMEKKIDEAKEVAKKIIEKKYEEFTDVFIILSMLINLKMHNEIVTYAAIALKKHSYESNLMIWYAESLYNTGNKQSAFKILYIADNLYGNYKDIKALIAYFEKDLPEVEYSLTLPLSEAYNKFAEFDAYINLGKDEFDCAVNHDTKFRDLTEWFFKYGNDTFLAPLIMKFSTVRAGWLEPLYREKLISRDLDFRIMSLLLHHLYNLYGADTVNLVALDRFKTVRYEFPEYFILLPPILRGAVQFAMNDIIFTDEEPQEYITLLRMILDGLVGFENATPIAFGDCSMKKLSALRSMRTLAGILLYKVYENEYDEDPWKSTIFRYGLKESTFKKYYHLIFGDKTADKMTWDMKLPWGIEDLNDGEDNDD